MKRIRTWKQPLRLRRRQPAASHCRGLRAQLPNGGPLLLLLLVIAIASGRCEAIAAGGGPGAIAAGGKTAVEAAAPASPSPAAATPATEADEPKAEPSTEKKWIRVLRDSDGKPVSLQTSVVEYVATEGSTIAKPGVHVDLIGAIHVGDRGYYRELNRLFQDYDALLYELVAPKGTVVPRGRGTSNRNPLGALQNGMKSLLGLEHQLEWINYQRSNFVHADMSPDEFFQRMKDRGESFLNLYFRVVGSEMARQSKQNAKGRSTELQLFTALFADDRERKIKIALANQFEDMDQLMQAFNGPDGSTLITERNKAAMDVLKEQLANGHRKLAIFYGAGHLEDMDERLIHEFGMKPVRVRWLDAWDLRD